MAPITLREIITGAPTTGGGGSEDDGGLSMGWIAGIGISASFVFVIGTMIIFAACRRRKTRRQEKMVAAFPTATWSPLRPLPRRPFSGSPLSSSPSSSLQSPSSSPSTTTQNLPPWALQRPSIITVPDKMDKHIAERRNIRVISVRDRAELSPVNYEERVLTEPSRAKVRREKETEVVEEEEEDEEVKVAYASILWKTEAVERMWQARRPPSIYTASSPLPTREAWLARNHLVSPTTPSGFL